MADKIMMKIAVDPGAGCWLWEGFLDKDGYGTVRSPKRGKMVLAHRASYGAFIGEVPSNLLVCHRCDTPACVRPEHLFLGTHTDNAEDMVAKGRSATGLKSGNRKNKNTLLHAEDVRYIRSSNLTNAELARHFGVAANTICVARKGVLWKWVL